MAYTINHVVLVGGNLTRDAELRYTNSGSALVSFSIAMNRRYKQGEQWEEKTDFFKIVFWGKPAEAISKFLTKGKKVAIEGRLSQNRWQSPDGKNMSSVEIIANNVVLMSRPQGGEGEQGPPAFEDYEQYPQDGGGYPPQGYQEQPGGYQQQQQGGYQQSNYQQPPQNPPQYGGQGYGGGYDQGPDTNRNLDNDIPF